MNKKDGSSEAKTEKEPNYLLGLVILIALTMAGEMLAKTFSLPLPGAIIGLCVLLLALSSTKRLPLAVLGGSRLLLKYLPLFLIPVCTGISQVMPTSLAEQLKILVTLVLAVTFGVFLTAYLTKHLFAKAARFVNKSPKTSGLNDAEDAE